MYGSVSASQRAAKFREYREYREHEKKEKEDEARQKKEKEKKEAERKKKMCSCNTHWYQRLTKHHCCCSELREENQKNIEDAQKNIDNDSLNEKKL